MRKLKNHREKIGVYCVHEIGHILFLSFSSSLKANQLYLSPATKTCIKKDLLAIGVRSMANYKGRLFDLINHDLYLQVIEHDFNVEECWIDSQLNLSCGIPKFRFIAKSRDGKIHRLIGYPMLGYYLGGNLYSFGNPSNGVRIGLHLVEFDMYVTKPTCVYRFHTLNYWPAQEPALTTLGFQIVDEETNRVLAERLPGEHASATFFRPILAWFDGKAYTRKC